MAGKAIDEKAIVKEIKISKFGSTNLNIGDVIVRVCLITSDLQR